MRQLQEKPELTERIMVSSDCKQLLNGMKLPKERIGDVVERALREIKRNEFLDYLDERAKHADYVPIESDPEMARMSATR